MINTFTDKTEQKLLTNKLWELGGGGEFEQDGVRSTDYFILLRTLGIGGLYINSWFSIYIGRYIIGPKSMCQML